MAAPSLTVAPADPAVPVDAPVRPAHPAAVVPCIPPAASLVVALREHVPASASVPAAPVVAPDSDSAPALVEHQASYRLPAKRRGRSAPAPMRAAAASSIPRPKKAR